MPTAKDSQGILDAELLLPVADALARGLDETEVGACIARAAGAMFPNAAVRLWGLAQDGETRYLLAEHGLRLPSDDRPLRPGEGLAFKSQQHGHPVYSEDVSQDPGFSKREWARSEGLRSALIQPLLSGGAGVGTLAVFMRERHVFSDEERRALELLAAHAALAVANTRVASDLRRKSEHLGGLIGVAAEVAATRHLDDALDGIVNRAVRLLAADGVGVRLFEDGRLVVRSAMGLALEAMQRQSVGLGEGIAGRAAVEPRPVVIPDVQAVDLGARAGNPGLQIEGIRALLAVPARKSGMLIAVLVFYNARTRWFRHDEVELASAFADLAAVVIENARLFEASERELRERERAEEALRSHRDDLEALVRERTRELELSHQRLIRQERLATLGQLTGTMGHELRNPLGTIRNSLELARVRLGDSRPDVTKAIERGVRNVTRCDRIIGDMLDFARIREPDLLSLEVGRWLSELMTDVGRNAEVSLDLDGGRGVWIQADPEQLRRAVVNLVDNAWHAMGADGEGTAASGPVRVGLRVREGQIGILVEDSGCGIADDVMPHVFEPLFSTKSFGVGLGLPYVRRIVEQHGGTLDLDSSPGAGTRVTMWLPRSAMKGSAPAPAG